MSERIEISNSTAGTNPLGNSTNSTTTTGIVVDVILDDVEDVLVFVVLEGVDIGVVVTPSVEIDFDSSSPLKKLLMAFNFLKSKEKNSVSENNLNPQESNNSALILKLESIKQRLNLLK